MNFMDKENIFPKLNPAGSESERPAEGKEVHKKHIVNRLNFINFQDGTVLVNFKHLQYGHTISHRAKPQPCLGEELTCLWTEPDKISQRLSSYKFQEIVVPTGGAFGRGDVLARLIAV